MTAFSAHSAVTAVEHPAATQRGRLGFLALVAVYAAVVVACPGTLAAAGDLSLGRQPWDNLVKTVGEFSRPSFVDAWLGEPRREYRSDDGTLLRVEDRRVVEASFLAALARGIWVTFQIATLGSLLAALLAALLALPLGLLAARNLNAPRPLAAAAGAVLDAARAVRSLVFGRVLVGLHLVPRLTARENVLIGALGRTAAQPGALPAWRSWARLYPPALRAEAADAAVARQGDARPMLSVAGTPLAAG